MAHDMDWMNLIGEVRVYWEPTEDRTIFHFVDTPGPVVAGYVKDLLAFLEENKTEGYTEQVEIPMEGYRHQLENAKLFVFCNHENRPDHVLVTLTDLDLWVREGEERLRITIRHKGWMDEAR